MSYQGKYRSMKIAGLMCLAAACMCMRAASAQQLGTRFNLRPAQVELAMERAQLPTQGVQVKLAAAVTSPSAETRLEVKSVAMLGPRDMRLRISCSDTSQCLPFFAIASYPEAINVATLPVKLDNKPVGSEQPVIAGKQAVSAVAGASASDRPTGSPAMRNGSAATLNLDSNKVHVSIDVVCLESGAPGEKIRVTTRDRKLVYVAEVVTSKLLKGTF